MRTELRIHNPDSVGFIQVMPLLSAGQFATNGFVELGKLICEQIG